MDTTEAVGDGGRFPVLGKLQAVELREVWPTEAQDFTPWLLANEGHLDPDDRGRIRTGGIRQQLTEVTVV